MWSPVTNPRRLPAFAARRAQFTGRPILALSMAALLTLPALAQASNEMSGGICRKASESFLDQAQGGIQTHMAQIRTRQKQLARASSRDVPRFHNQLQLSDKISGNIPLATRGLQPGTARLLNSAPGKTNVYVRGTLYSFFNFRGMWVI